MTTMIPVAWPTGAAFWTRLGHRLMDVILHLGAHRTATTTFQHYLRDQMEGLSGQGVAYWGPQHTRHTVFPGLFRPTIATKGRNLARRAEGRVRMFCQQAQSQGVQHLLVSDENLLGNCHQNLTAARLYPGAGERTARVSAAFGGRLRRVVLSIRSLDLWWASACALTVSRGHPVPSARCLDTIAASRRTWRDVIIDLACAAPGAEIEVMPFENHAGRPDAVLRTALDREVPADAKNLWLNRSPDQRALRATLAEAGADPELLPDDPGRWQPFDTAQAAELRENYADDLHWLVAGADGLARLTEDRHPKRADKSPPQGAMTKGQGHDKGHMAQHR